MVFSIIIGMRASYLKLLIINPFVPNSALVAHPVLSMILSFVWKIEDSLQFTINEGLSTHNAGF